MLESYDNVILRGEDTKYDADILATDLAERRGFIKEFKTLLIGSKKIL